MHLSAADLAPLRELYSRGLYLQTWHRASALGPLREWENAAARVMAGRLAMQLGAPRLGRVLHITAWRAEPTHPEATYYHARAVLEQFGPLPAWRFLRKNDDFTDAAPEVRADWFALHAFVAARLRDFDRADRWQKRAEALAPQSPWIVVERAAALEFAERPADALAEAQRALELQPWFRPAVQAAAHLLQQLDRPAEALDLLTEADSRLESGLVVAQLSAAQFEAGHYADARRSYERYAELSPLLELQGRHWLAGRRSDAAYFTGDFGTALEQAKLASEGLPFFTGLVKNLEQGRGAEQGSGVRGQGTGEEGPEAQSGGASILPLTPDHLPLTPAPRLDVPFVRQKDGQLAAALLVGLAKFWGRELPAPTGMEAVCLDGLPDSAERRWAEANGFVAREFTITIDTLLELLRRGVPVLMSAVDANYTHAQVIVGHDPRRDTIFLRDANQRMHQEALMGVFLDRYQGTGPRGTILLPPDKLHLLDGIVLRDAERYDRLLRLQSALTGSCPNREAAIRELDALTADAPEHRLTLQAKCVIDRFDGNLPGLLRTVGRLMELFPEDSSYRLSYAGCLRDLSRKEERIRLLRQWSVGAEGESMFGPHLAQAVWQEPHEQDEADSLLRRTVRQRPYLAAAYLLLGHIAWERQRWDDALEWYRFAACLDEKDDNLWQAYFRAARQRGQTPDALRFLQTRMGRLGAESSQPARALAGALFDLDQPEDTFRVITRALEKHPDDGLLLIYAAEHHAAFGQFAKADAAMERARGKAPEALWLRAAADLATQKGELAAAVGHWRAVIAVEPLNVDAHRALARLLADSEGRAAALAHLASVTEKYPHHFPMMQTHIDWLRPDGSPAVEPVVRRLIAAHPEDAWSRRELALHLAEQGRHDEAKVELDIAGRIDPNSPSWYCVSGRVHSLANRHDEARAAWRGALTHSVDTEIAIPDLVSSRTSEDGKTEEVEFIFDELMRQHHTGDGLYPWREQAAAVLEPDDVTDRLRQLHDAHPHLWQTWSLLIQQLGMTGQVEAANGLAQQAVERFPLSARLWIDLAHVCQAREDTEGQIDALKSALKVMPGWGPASRDLAEALEESEKGDEARQTLELAVARVPLDPVNHGYLADLLWRQGESEPAVARLEAALRTDPGYEWAWRQLSDWCERLEERERVANLARELCKRRAGDPRVWLALARSLGGPAHSEETLAALDKAIALNPKNIEAYDLKAERLTEAGRFDEAIATCKAAAGLSPPTPRTPPAEPSRPPSDAELIHAPEGEGVPVERPELESDLPLILQGRIAWVEARRGNYAAAIPPMQALVAVEPGYYWGWQQLADWYNETGRHAAYLEAASELVRLRPDSPIALARRGEARLQTGDREGGKADLRQAQQVAPDYPFAGMALFDALLADDEVDEARRALAILQEHLSDDLVLTRQAQLAARLEDEETALDVLRELATNGNAIDTGAVWPLQNAVQALRTAGWSEGVDRVLEEATKEERFHPWAALAWVESPGGQAADLARKLEVLDRAATAAPHFLPAYDFKAELLARHGRFDEASEACRPASLPTVPTLLRGRAAWVEAARGDRPKAIRMMREVVTDDPDYQWGWRQLANWSDAAQAYTDYLEAADNLVRLAPRDPEAFGYRGEAKLHVGDRKGAKDDFKTAYRLDGQYAFAGLHLLDAQLQDGELDDATETLAGLIAHHDSALVRLRAVRLAMRKDDAPAAEEHFRCLVTDDEAPAGLLARAAETMHTGRYATIVERVLEDSLGDPAANAAVGRLWVERRLAAGDFGAAARLRGLLDQGEVGIEALRAFVDGLARPAMAGRLAALVAEHGPDLKRDTVAWAKAGLALAAAGMSPRAVDWMADWEERDDLEPWMLLPLAIGLRSQGRIAEARAVHEAALSLDEPDDASLAHSVWLGADAALAGDVDSAEASLVRDGEQLDPYHRIVNTLALALVRVRRADDRSAAFAAVRQAIMPLLAKESAHLPVDAALAKFYADWVQRLAAETGTWRATLWAWGQKVWPALAVKG